MTRSGALAGIITGTVVVLLWVYGPFTLNGEPLSSVIYEIVPAFISASVAIVAVSMLGNEPSELNQDFDFMKERLSSES